MRQPIAPMVVIAFALILASASAFPARLDDTADLDRD
jgi:hypothetical protein